MKVNCADYEKKVQADYTFTLGEVKFTKTKTVILGAIAFCVALLAAACGIGPGLIFNPVLIQLDSHASVASATGMYLTLFTTLASTINMFIFKSINISYCLMIGTLTIIGTVPGVYGQELIVRKASGRTQFTVMIVIFFLCLPALTVLPLNVSVAKDEKASG